MRLRTQSGITICIRDLGPQAGSRQTLASIAHGAEILRKFTDVVKRAGLS